MIKKYQLTVILFLFVFVLVACGGGDESTPIAPELTPEVTPEVTAEVSIRLPDTGLLMANL